MRGPVEVVLEARLAVAAAESRVDNVAAGKENVVAVEEAGNVAQRADGVLHVDNGVVVDLRVREIAAADPEADAAMEVFCAVVDADVVAHDVILP